MASRVPWPPRRGDQLRTLQLVAALAPDHQVTALVPAPAAPPQATPGVRWEGYDPGPAAARGARAAAAFGRGLPAQSGLFAAPDLRRRMAALAPTHDRVVLQLVRLAPLAPQLAGAHLVADLIDALSLSFATRARTDRPLLRPFWRLEARRLERAEGRLMGAAAKSLVVCERDRGHLVARHPAGAERLAVVPLGVPAAAGVRQPPPFPTVAFTGNLGYFPNRQAALWLLREVWPRLRRRCPDARLLLAGERPGARLRRCAARAGAELVAAPGDLRAELSRARVAVAPVASGSGTPLKILDAWAEQVPVVASAFAAAGVGGAEAGGLVVAEGPAEWAAAIHRLLAEPALARQLAAAGRARLQADYSPQATAAAMRRAVVG